MDWGLKDQSKCVLKANFTGEINYWLKERLMDRSNSELENSLKSDK